MSTTALRRERMSDMAQNRDVHLDNARGVLITLVVVGHVIAQIDTAASDVLNSWIYVFHMPAFVALAGYFSRSYAGNPRQLKSLVTKLLVPYVVFQVLLAVVDLVFDGGTFDPHLVVPAFSMWFLLALFTWRLLTPVLRQLRAPLAVAVAVSVLAPFADSLDQQLSAARMLSFLPFFVLGLVVRPGLLEMLRTRRAAVLGGAALLAGLAAMVVAAPRFSRSLLHMSGSYADLGEPGLYAALVRVVILGAGLAGAAAVIAVSPRRSTFLAELGRRSLTIYLWQAVLVLIFMKSDLADTWDTTLGLVLAVVGAILLTLLLGSGPVTRLTDAMTAPLGRLLVRQDAPTASADAANGR